MFMKDKDQYELRELDVLSNKNTWTVMEFENVIELEDRQELRSKGGTGNDYWQNNQSWE